MKDLKLKGGVLIIGSLFWEKINGREAWRFDSLGKNYKKKTIKVESPIRYGRYSGTKDEKMEGRGRYTMVLSTEFRAKSKLGFAMVIPFKKKFTNTDTQLSEEVNKMSDAEGMNLNFVGKSNGEIYAVMGIIFNPKYSAKLIQKEVIDWWQEQIVWRSGMEKGEIIKTLSLFKRNSDPTSALTERGELNINWPQAVRKKEQSILDQLDFLIAACTKPEHKNKRLKRYPKPQEIAIAVKKDKSRCYFKNNVLHSISTSQDVEILEELRKKS